jgi:hypothetical protein
LVNRPTPQAGDKASLYNSLDTLDNYPQSLINTRKITRYARSKIFDLEKRPDFIPTF